MSKTPELEILDVAELPPSDRARGRFRVLQQDGEGLRVIGWVLGTSSPATEVEVLTNKEAVGRTSVALERPDIAKQFPDVSEAATCGFRLDLAAQGKGKSDLEVWALLADGGRELLGRIVVKANRRRLFDALRRG
jgi:hypothetical protein